MALNCFFIRWWDFGLLRIQGCGSKAAAGVKVVQANGTVQAAYVGSWQVCCYCLVTKLCLTLCGPTDNSPSGSSVHGILQARILEWIAIPFSGGSSWPRDWTPVSWTAGGFFYCWPTGGPPGRSEDRANTRVLDSESWTRVQNDPSLFFPHSHSTP